MILVEDRAGGHFDHQRGAGEGTACPKAEQGREDTNEGAGDDALSRPGINGVGFCRTMALAYWVHV